VAASSRSADVVEDEQPAGEQIEIIGELTVHR
jgi:hypothetical protein